MSISSEHYRSVQQRAQLLIPPGEVEAAIDRMADRITTLLADRDPLVLCLMNGAVILVGRLLPRLRFQLRLDYLHATRYRGGTRGGELSWLRRPTEAIRGQHLLLMDDILDEGITLSAAIAACREDGAASVLSAVLVEKERPHTDGVRADVIGVRVPDRYVFGYGLDYKGYFRNADGIFAVADEDVS